MPRATRPGWRRPHRHERTRGARSLEWFWSLYLSDIGDADAAAPPRARDLRALPPALVITAEHDPLRDKREYYAERLRQDGVDAAVERYGGMVHGFLSMSRLPASRAAAAALRGGRR